jgi:biofilm PGA synthesis N-glycosyltransferase PgaC
MTAHKKNLYLSILKKSVIYGSLYFFTCALVVSAFILAPRTSAEFPLLRMVIVVFASVLLTKYFMYMVLSPWHEVLAAFKHAKLKADFHPKVSVLIPAWNEEVGLLTTVKSVLASTYRNLEIVVVNDGSTDNSDALMREFITEYAKTRKRRRPNIVYHYQENAGKGSALNKAIALSSGDILISIDADCEVDTLAVENFVKVFQNPKVKAAVGNVKIGNTRTILGTVQYLEFLFSFYFKRADSLLNTIYIIGGARYSLS